MNQSSYMDIEPGLRKGQLEKRPNRCFTMLLMTLRRNLNLNLGKIYSNLSEQHRGRLPCHYKGSAPNYLHPSVLASPLGMDEQPHLDMATDKRGEITVGLNRI